MSEVPRFADGERWGEFGSLMVAFKIEDIVIGDEISMIVSLGSSKVAVYLHKTFY